eukprot:jgi/Tetstr1/457524/TSEL_044104.t1
MAGDAEESDFQKRRQGLSRIQSARREQADTTKSVPSTQDMEDGDLVSQGELAPRDANDNIVYPASKTPTGGAATPPTASQPTVHTLDSADVGRTDPELLPSDEVMATEEGKLLAGEAAAVPQDYSEGRTAPDDPSPLMPRRAAQEALAAASTYDPGSAYATDDDAAAATSKSPTAHTTSSRSGNAPLHAHGPADPKKPSGQPATAHPSRAHSIAADTSVVAGSAGPAKLPTSGLLPAPARS